jgi:hypothetical protein
MPSAADVSRSRSPPAVESWMNVRCCCYWTGCGFVSGLNCCQGRPACKPSSTAICKRTSRSRSPAPAVRQVANFPDPPIRASCRLISDSGNFTGSIFSAVGIKIVTVAKPNYTEIPWRVKHSCSDMSCSKLGCSCRFALRAARLSQASSGEHASNLWLDPHPLDVSDPATLRPIVDIIKEFQIPHCSRIAGRRSAASSMRSP